ncbi:MAG: MoxR family ATPase [Saprospiraceae bacterium]|nr:MoxR family ATPase [Saprospiraceae bacterium]
MMENQEQNAMQPLRETLDLGPTLEMLNAVQEECHKVLVGQQELIDLLLIAMLADGHILLEGVPGIAKTLSAKVMARVIDTGFSRIQFTPDLMPSDIIGTSIYDLKSSEFVFKKGPIFSNIILIDEINRAPAKTQSALFEVMEEKQITFDGQTLEMEMPFMVIATQNPIEQEGTYRLPEGQLDRFLMKVNLGYPSADDELQILKRFKDQMHRVDLSQVKKVLNRSDLIKMQETLKRIFIEDQMLNYISEIVQETRNHAQIYLGASPRAALAILKSSKVAALIAGRDFVIPDDIQAVMPHVLNHRLILTPVAEMENITTLDIIDDIIRTIEVPR